MSNDCAIGVPVSAQGRNERGHPAYGAVRPGLAERPRARVPDPDVLAAATAAATNAAQDQARSTRRRNRGYLTWIDSRYFAIWRILSFTRASS